VDGITKALELGKTELGISSHLIMCFLRHLSQEDGFKTLKESLPFKDKIIVSKDKIAAFKVWLNY
jgi:adenosine deaminase